MKILVVISSLGGGGAERAVSSLSRMWLECGHDVRVLTISSQHQDAYRLDVRVSRVALNLERQSSGLASAIWNNALRLWRLRHELYLYGPDVIVAFMPTANVLSALAKVGTRVKVIGCERVHPPQNLWSPVREFFRYWGYGLLNAATAQTIETADWLRTNTMVRTVHVIPNPATWPLPDHLPIRSTEIACRPGRRILLAVGRLEVQKGFTELLQVFSVLCGRHPDWDLVIIGEGSLRPELELFIADQKLTDRAYLPGRVGNMADWYSRASLFVLSSGFEGFPNALVEAMSHGVASVSYDCDTGPRNIIRNDIDGILVPNGKPACLSDALQRLMSDDECRQKMSQRASEIRGRLSEGVIANLWERLFNSMDQNVHKK